MLTVTRPLEQALMEVPGIRRVRSTTFRGATEISAQFDPATDMVVALQQAQSRVAEIRGELPADLDLVVERLTPTAFPFLSVNLTGRPVVGGPARLRLLRDAAGAVARRRRRQRRSARRATRARSRSSPIRRGSPPPA